jgi:hypothetical protein
MRIVRHAPVLAAILTVVLAAPGRADNNPNGMSFRAVGWFKGKAEITQGRINCEIPNVSNAISEGSFVMGLWNTFGRPTLYFPDINNETGNPCGGWIQLQNNLFQQAINLDRIELRYRIGGARRFQQAGVPTLNKFPSRCRQFRRETQFLGNRLNPSNSTDDTSSSGAPNVAFIEMLPMVTPQLISCLRDEYTALPTTTFTSFPLIIRATAIGVSDSGDTFRSNTIQYTLTLRHTCGNGRIDDGEVCDASPLAPNACAGFCNSGHCSQNDAVPCADDTQCNGTCMPQSTPSECLCVY